MINNTGSHCEQRINIKVITGSHCEQWVNIKVITVQIVNFEKNLYKWISYIRYIQLQKMLKSRNKSSRMEMKMKYIKV